MKEKREVLSSKTVKRKKELGLDSQGIQKTMRFNHYLGDGAAMFATNAISGLVGIITYFYTDKIGLAAGVVGTIMLLTRILDAFTDLIIGKLVDSTKSKYGKARPWLLWVSLPTLLAIILLFTAPANASITIKYIYVFITLFLATGIVYTAIQVPYGSLMALRTRSTEERGKMGITRAVFGYIIGMIIAIILIPASNMLGGDQRAWIILGIVLGVVSSIALLITFFTSKEETEIEKAEEDNASFFESLKLIFKNKYFVIALFITLFSQMLYALINSTGPYYAEHILGNDNLVGIMGAVGLIPTIIGFSVVGPMMKKFGLAKTARIGMLVGILGTGIRTFMPYSFIATLVFGSLTTFATIPLMAIGSVLVTNTIEYGEWKSGKRLVGMVNSTSSFGMKIGVGLGTAVVGWILAIGNYDGSLATQPDSAVISILTISIYLPLVLLIITYLLLRMYDLDQKYPQIVKELEERKGKETD